MQSTFDTYSKIKQQLSGLTYKGIDLCGPSSAVLANLLYSKKSKRRTNRDAFKLIWRKPKHSNREELKGSILTWNTRRPDHKQSAEDIYKTINTTTMSFRLVRIPDLTEDCKRSLNPKPLWKAFLLTRSTGVERKYFLYTLSAITYSVRYYDSLKKYNIPGKISKLIAYNSSNIPECFIVAACNKEGIPTYSLQHGIYQDYKASPPLDVINYENVTARTLLVWSDFCHQQITNFYKRSQRPINFDMIIAGYLKPIHKNQNFSTSKTKIQSIICLLPRDEIASSRILLEVLCSLNQGYQIIVRPHPISQKEKILPDPLPNNFIIDTAKTLDITLTENNIVLAVGFNTTSLFDTLLSDIPCALFNTPDSNFTIPELPNFSSTEELKTVLKNPEPTTKVANYILGANISRYAAIAGS